LRQPQLIQILSIKNFDRTVPRFVCEGAVGVNRTFGNAEPPGDHPMCTQAGVRPRQMPASNGVSIYPALTMTSECAKSFGAWQPFSVRASMAEKQGANPTDPGRERSGVEELAVEAGGEGRAGPRENLNAR
jgi:hypothetical protein